MPSLVERVRMRIQDPRLTTSINAFVPRQPGLFPPTTSAIVEAAEAKLGFSLPPLLRQLYTEVGNGGFGPGYGLFGLEGGYTDPQIIDPSTSNLSQGGTLVEWYFTYRGMNDNIPELNHEFSFESQSVVFIDPEPRPGNWNWFDKLVPISNHGDWQLSCVDCSKSAFPVLFYKGQQSELRLESHTFDEWIENWLNSS
jgi:hypothetical protein